MSEYEKLLTLVDRLVVVMGMFVTNPTLMNVMPAQSILDTSNQLDEIHKVIEIMIINSKKGENNAQ